jgi:integrase
MRAKITIRSVDDLAPIDGREVTMHDTELSGFEVRARAGGAKVYGVRYRVGSGRGSPMRRFTIGKHGSPWTPETARAEARRLLASVVQGRDPAGAKAERKAAPTVAEFAARFLREHAEAKRKTRTALEYARLLDKIVVPALGAKKIADVTRQDVSRLHHALSETPYQANRVLAVLAKMFNLAEAWGERPDGSNPCRHITKFPEKARERMLSADELARLGEVLATDDGGPYAVAAIRLLVFTGARLSEILGLRWEWIDFERREARLPDSKAGARTIHLSAPALEVLASLPRIDANAHVIAGQRSGAPLVNLEKPWRRVRDRATVCLWAASSDAAINGLVRRLAEELDREPSAAECRRAAGEAGLALPTGLSDVRLHDLRHGFASIAASAGMGLLIIGEMLGHAQAQTTQRYAHLSADPVKAAVENVASRIASAMGASAAETATVVTLRR